MKKAYLFIALVLLSCNVLAQRWNWARSFETPQGFDHVFRNTDPQGHFYMKGYYQDSITLDGHTITTFTPNSYTYKRFLARFDSAGICDMLMNLPDSLSAIQADHLGNIYMIRYFTGSTQFSSTTFTSQGDFGFYMVKYRPDLTVDWVKQGDLHSLDSPQFTITIDNNNDVVINMLLSDSARFDGQLYLASGGYNTLTIKLTSSGSRLWHSTLYNCFPLSMKADKNNDLLFIAHVHDSCYLVNTWIYHESDIGYYYLVKYKSDGTPELYKELWTCYKSATPIFETDNSTNVYVINTGEYSASSIVKYDGLLNQLWQKSWSIYNSIFIDKYDRIFVSGAKMNPAVACVDTIPEYTFAYGQIDSSGNCIWNRTLPTLDHDHYAGVHIVATGSYDKLIGIGSNNVSFALDNITIPGDTFTRFIASMSISGTPLALTEGEPASALNIYPNPSSGAFIVDGASGSIVIRDITGRELYRKEKASAGEKISLDNFSNGIYMVEVSDGKNKSCKKLVVQK